MRVRYSFGSRHTGRLENIKKQRQKYPNIMKDVIRISDIILEILDARFIEETRNLKIEEEVLSKGKILIYVINKSDLVDIEALKETLPSWMKPYVFVSATKGIGLKDLKGRIKMEAKRLMKSRKESKDTRKQKFDKNKAVQEKEEKREIEKLKSKTGKLVVKDLESKQRIHVGVIGYPNAGKSSVINFITRRGVAKTAKQAGFTKGLQKIRMSENILILDTPGVIPKEKYSTEKKTFAKDVKVGGRTYSDVKNPEDVVYYLITPPIFGNPDEPTEEEVEKSEEVEKNEQKISKFYEINFQGNVEKLIEELGKKMKYLGKGGKVDIDRTARLILRDWQEGKIR